MKNQDRLLGYLKTALAELVESGAFSGGQEFRHSQDMALKAYLALLQNNALSVEEKLRRFFEIPSGVGKTAIFIGIIEKMMAAAERDGSRLRSMIVVPTIKLLYQTKKRFAEFAPAIADKIGFYGDGHKDLRKPVTIISYDSWAALVDEGRLTSDNVDILISDEGHRGTSQKRVDHIWNAFDYDILSLGFTATARFDEKKTIALTHNAPAFERSLIDAVKDGELAAYIQSMLYIIRVLPPTLAQEFAAAEQGLENYHSELKRLAWSQRVVAILRDGVDPQTGDLLSDNQIGVFCASTRHADQTEVLLNTDEVLRFKATQLGMKGVAVAVHSSLTKKQQRERLEEYENGQWMIVLSDELLKEGYDYPPMKTLVDYYHMSLVDKGQIIGRTSRQWENTVKMRYEGATIIDVLAYVGDHDPDTDAAIRRRMLRNAVLSWDIIGGTQVLSQGYTPVPQAKRPKKENGLSVVDIARIVGHEVEAYVELESLDIVHAEREKIALNSDEYIEITEAMRQGLKQHQRRTKTGPGTLLKNKNNPFPSLTRQNIWGWMNLQRVKNVRKDHYEWVIANWESLSAEVGLEKEDRKIPFTEGMYQILRQEYARTGVGFIMLYEESESRPESLSKEMVKTWSKSIAKVVRQNHYDWALKQYHSLPDDPYTPLNPEILDLINREVARTGIKGAGLLKKAENPPEGLTGSFLTDWARPQARNAKKRYVDWVIRAYKSFPDGGGRQNKLKPSLV